MTRIDIALIVLLAAMSPSIKAKLPTSDVENNFVDRFDHEFGKPNPKAPAALSGFAFLIGRWRCEARLKSPNGEWQRLQATWVGRYILDGYAIEDEYRMTGSSGDLIVLGLNFRVYDTVRQAWNIKWLNALDGTWWDLGTPELGGVRFEDQSVTYSFKQPVRSPAYQRVTYTNISKTHFTWRGEASHDGKAWSEFMVIEANRSKE
jgi:hypothetical protein